MAKLEAAAVIVVGGIVAYMLYKARGLWDVPGNVSTYISDTVRNIFESDHVNVTDVFRSTWEQKASEAPGTMGAVSLPTEESRTFFNTAQILGDPKNLKRAIVIDPAFPGAFGKDLFPAKYWVKPLTIHEGHTLSKAGYDERMKAYAPSGASVRAPLPVVVIGSRGTYWTGGSGGGSGSYQESKRFPGEPVKHRETLKTGEKVYL